MGCHSTARLVKSPKEKLQPTTWPLAVTAAPLLAQPPRLPRSIIPPACVHEKAWGPLLPTTWPLSFTATAMVGRPPGAPRSIIPPAGVHEKACPAPSLRVLTPTTWPLALTATATL